MSGELQQIRTAIDRGLAIDNLRSITNLSLKVLEEDAPRHPSVFFVLASLSRWVADAWDDFPLSVQVANRVDGQLRAHLVALLDAASGSPAEVSAALDAVAEAFREAIRFGLDS